PCVVTVTATAVAHQPEGLPVGGEGLTVAYVPQQAKGFFADGERDGVYRAIGKDSVDTTDVRGAEKPAAILSRRPPPGVSKHDTRGIRRAGSVTRIGTWCGDSCVTFLDSVVDSVSPQAVIQPEALVAPPTCAFIRKRWLLLPPAR